MHTKIQFIFCECECIYLCILKVSLIEPEVFQCSDTGIWKTPMLSVLLQSEGYTCSQQCRLFVGIVGGQIQVFMLLWQATSQMSHFTKQLKRKGEKNGK